MRPVSLLVGILGISLFAPPALSKTTRIEVVPGPSTISDAEKAIVADPASGAEHAVILIEETDRDDNQAGGPDSVTRYHLRAKILSNEGRDLANVRIPFISRESRLEEWWGRTLLPDGTVLELKREKVGLQSVVRTPGADVGYLAAALPGVVPGCVIDYGYQLKERLFSSYHELDLERQWPIQKLRYRFEPTEYLLGAYSTSNIEKRDIQVTVDGGAILVTGSRLRARLRETMMPPDHEVHAKITLYYLHPDTDFNNFWNNQAKTIERTVRAFIGKEKPLREAVQGIGITPDAGGSGLEKAYEWVRANVRNTSLLTSEELEKIPENEERRREGARRTLEAKSGSDFEVKLLYVALARAMDADAHLVLASDRRSHAFDPELKSLLQFNTVLVEVKSGKEAARVVDPGSELPYGEVPWWVTGTKGLVVTERGSRTIELDRAPSGRNVAEVKGTLRFSEDGTSLLASWTRGARGQTHLELRRLLRWMDAKDRRDMIDSLCGDAGDTEVLSAEAPGIENPGAEFRLSCETSRDETGLATKPDVYRLTLVGPWTTRLPALPAGPRTQPVVFDYPKIERLTFDVNAPAGFEPTSAPAPARIEGAYGSYALAVTATDTGYHVEREMVLSALVVPAGEYEALRGFLAEIERCERTSLEFRRKASR